ncbi:hypothetical protein RJT34_32418 [Clitoria ternatea]|uniref:Uncharacterized protein n=1 Tax=Clitoria ternatea TaxID=43366 RepID=A0AAN9EWD8_CLITE
MCLRICVSCPSLRGIDSCIVKGQQIDRNIFHFHRGVGKRFLHKILILELYYTGDTHVLPKTHLMRLSVTLLVAFALGTATGSSP